MIWILLVSAIIIVSFQQWIEFGKAGREVLPRP